MRQLEGRVAAVTGAASGIGRALALALTARGCRVAAADVDEAALAELAPEVHSTHLVDVSDKAQVDAWAHELAGRGPVHILVNNAGLTVGKAFDDHTDDDWDRVLGVNLYGVLHGCRAFLPHLRAADEAHLVNISSIFGVVGVPSQAAYCTSKFAVRGLTEVLWEELRGTSVGVTVVHPGGVRTGIARHATMDDAEAQRKLVRFFEKHAMSPRRVATRIVTAIERDQPRVLVAPEAYLFDLARRIAPVLGNRFSANAVMRSMGLQAIVDNRRAELG